MGFEIRIGNEDEIVIAHQLMKEAFDEYRDLDVPSSAVNEPIDILRNSFLNGTESFILCFLDEVPVGSLRFMLQDDSIYFSRVSVPPFARRKGIAKSMLKWLENYANKQGKIKAVCKVRASLSDNVRLYESIGYVITKEGIVKNPNGFEVKTVIMEKSNLFS
ncbi:GNAT family N-acetyltransferase [Neobacillus bataviensis]|uniref:GNAT family N-acetyltransferase n=1 Tax=Neobacillus bataviensis TaxID=220685 RepID=UPI001CBA955C|nr:GNAT family N-acetyltransferase [Neobacillus bataviensis]